MFLFRIPGDLSRNINIIQSTEIKIIEVYALTCESGQFDFGLCQYSRSAGVTQPFSQAVSVMYFSTAPMVTVP